MKTTEELNIPIHKEKHDLIAGKTTTIILPEPFKISDSILKIESDHTLKAVSGEYRIKLSGKEPGLNSITDTFTITSPTYIAFEERKQESELFLNDEEFYVLEITATKDISVVIVFENKLSTTRMNYLRTLFLRHTIL